MEYRVRRRYDAQCVPTSRAQRRLPVPDPISDALVRRFLLRAGFRASTDRAVAHVRQYMTDLLEKLLESMVAFMVHDRCFRFRLVHVMNACRVHGIRLYGFDDVCALESHGAIEPYHVTEMVELNTTFGGPEQLDDEPDVEPGARFTKTDFVANYTARAAEYEDESDDDDDSDDSEWSWYGESDADSDSDSDCESETERASEDNQVEAEEDVEMDRDANERELKPWQRPPRENQFIASLKAAQAIVDDQLLHTDGSDDDVDDDDMDANAPQGQGYDSDRDDMRESAAVFKYTQAIEREDALWDTSSSVHEADEDDAAQVIDAIQAGDDTQQYVMSRQAFATFFRSRMDRYDCEISSVALSALHNASEQQLHRALTDGVVAHELQTMIREAQAAQQQLELEVALATEREKVTERDHTIAELKAALKAKKLAMQHQIALLQHQLSVQQRSSNNDDVQMQTPTRTPKKPTPKKRKSPGKRKATTNSKHGEVVRKETTLKSSTGSKSLVGSLRSKIQDYALRTKKVRVNPV